MSITIYNKLSGHDLEGAIDLLKKGEGDPGYIGGVGTALMRITRSAIEHSKQPDKYIEIVKLLLETGESRPDFQDNKRDTALIIAAGKGYVIIVKLLLQNSVSEAHPEYQNNDGMTALLSAILGYTRNIDKKYIKIVKLLLETGESHPEYEDNRGMTALMQASIIKDTILLELLLQRSDAHPEYQSKKTGETALMFASNNYVEPVRLLLQRESHPEYQDKKGNTALINGVRMGNERIVELLLETGESHPEYTDKDGVTALMWASKYEKKETVKLLLKYKSSCVMCKNKKGKTAAQLSMDREIRYMIVSKMIPSFQQVARETIWRPGRYISHSLYDEDNTQEDCIKRFPREFMLQGVKHFITNFSKFEIAGFISNYGSDHDINKLCGVELDQVNSRILESECTIQELVKQGKLIAVRMNSITLCKVFFGLAKNYKMI